MCRFLDSGLTEDIISFRLSFKLGLEGCRPNYTKAALGAGLANILKPAYCESAFEGAAVMADPPRSARCIRSRPGSLGISPRPIFPSAAIPKRVKIAEAVIAAETQRRLEYWTSPYLVESHLLVL